MALKSVHPLGNKILVKRTSKETTLGGILLPESSQEKPKQGEVIAVGPGKIDEKGKMKPLTVTVGETVVFTSYAGTKVELSDDEEYLIMSEDDVLAILN